jgi:hypothetical protein
MLVNKYYLDGQTVVDGISWIHVCKVNGGEENACIIWISKPEEKRALEFPGIAERKIGPKNDLKIKILSVWRYVSVS